VGKYRIRAITHTDAAVKTASEKTWRSFINQTLRWNNGGLFSPEAFTRFNYNLSMLVISTGSFAILLLPLIPTLWVSPAGVFVIMILNTIAAFGLFRTKLPRGGLFKYFACLLFMPFYLTLMTLMGYARVKTTWKEN
jgi:cellulose synthase/poly-beta-1,6-N-acetylglucosamine synthase-like glycosyltransferase